MRGGGGGAAGEQPYIYIYSYISRYMLTYPTVTDWRRYPRFRVSAQNLEGLRSLGLGFPDFRISRAWESRI